MELLSDILKLSLKKHGLGESAFASMLINRANQIIREELGTLAIKNIRVKKIEKKIIYIEITKPAWAQEFHFFRHEFLNKIRESFPKKQILDIRIKIIGREDLYDTVQQFGK